MSLLLARPRRESSSFHRPGANRRAQWHLHAKLLKVVTPAVIPYLMVDAGADFLQMPDVSMSTGANRRIWVHGTPTVARTIYSMAEGSD
jgi:hypothetical protein